MSVRVLGYIMYYIISFRPLLSDYDPFQGQKETSFIDSVDQMKTISTQLIKYMTIKPTVNQNMFTEYLMVSIHFGLFIYFILHSLQQCILGMACVFP